MYFIPQLFRFHPHKEFVVTHSGVIKHHINPLPSVNGSVYHHLDIFSIPHIGLLDYRLPTQGHDFVGNLLQPVEPTGGKR
jgi:hypothetical protein